MNTLTKNKLQPYLLLAILTVSIQTTFAQDNSSEAKYYGGFGYFQLGYQMMDLSAFNDALNENGYPDLENGSVSIGGGGHYLIRNWIIGGEGYGLPGSKSENSSYKVSHAGGYGFFNIGYSIVQRPAFSLAPIIGIGGGGMTVSLREKSANTSSFDEILDEPGRESYLTHGGFMLNFSVLAHYMVLGTKTEDVSGGLLFGLKAGYILNLDGENWYLDEQKLSQSPASSISGFYVSLVIGGGGAVRK